MKTLSTAVLFVVVIGVVLVMSSWAGEPEPRHYFGSGAGYPDYGSSKYFYTYYPPEQWDKYGYGTGDLGMGYGPYVYSKGKVDTSARAVAEQGGPMLTPALKWIGGNEVRVSAPRTSSTVKKLTVEVLAWNGGVLTTETVAVAPFEAVVRLTEGATTIRVRTDTADGFSAIGIPIEPAK